MQLNKNDLQLGTIDSKRSDGIYTSTNSTILSTKDRIFEIKEGEETFSNKDKMFIGELLGDLDLNNDQERAFFLQSVFDNFPDATIDDVKSIIPSFPDDLVYLNEKRNGEGMGALVNYNTEIKNKWRQKLKDFINENTDKEKRSTMKVLCLPGVECLEIPLYLELGFKAENIIGVEAGIVKGKKDPEIIARFQENAAKYGIQTRIGKIEKILEIEKTVFDVVSLDFVGPINLTSRIVAQRILLSDRSIICTNYLNRREGNFGKMQLFTGNFANNTSSIPINYGDLMNITDPYKTRHIDVPSGEDKSDSHHRAILNQFTGESGRVHPEIRQLFSDYRKLDNSTVLYQGKEKKTIDAFDGNEYNFMNISELHHLMIVGLIDAFERQGLHHAIHSTQSITPKQQIDINMQKIQRLIPDLLLSEYRVDPNCKASYQYIGNTNSPMYSDFFVLCSLNQKEKAPFLKCTRFFAKFASCVMGKYPGYQILIKRKNPKLHIFDLEDEIHLLDKHRTILAAIKLRNIENARFEWRGNYGTDPLLPPVREKILSSINELENEVKITVSEVVDLTSHNEYFALGNINNIHQDLKLFARASGVHMLELSTTKPKLGTVINISDNRNIRWGTYLNQASKYFFDTEESGENAHRKSDAIEALQISVGLSPINKQYFSDKKRIQHDLLQFSRASRVSVIELAVGSMPKNTTVTLSNGIIISWKKFLVLAQKYFPGNPDKTTTIKLLQKVGDFKPLDDMYFSDKKRVQYDLDAFSSAGGIKLHKLTTASSKHDIEAIISNGMLVRWSRYIDTAGRIFLQSGTNGILNNNKKSALDILFKIAGESRVGNLSVAAEYFRGENTSNVLRDLELFAEFGGVEIEKLTSSNPHPSTTVILSNGFQISWITYLNNASKYFLGTKMGELNNEPRPGVALDKILQFIGIEKKI